MDRYIAPCNICIHHLHVDYTGGTTPRTGRWNCVRNGNREQCVHTSRPVVEMTPFVKLIPFNVKIENKLQWVNNHVYSFVWACIAVMATVLTISVTVHPRLRSLTGLFKPCNTGPIATPPDVR